MDTDVMCSVCGWGGTYCDLDLQLRGEPRCPNCLSDELDYLEADDEADL